MSGDPARSAGRADALSVHRAAVEVAEALAAAGHRALFAGGCVRDALMGREPADYDIATDARPEQVKAVFPKARGVGEAFGVMLVRHGGHTFEVASFRKDGPYRDGRRPSHVEFSDECEDAARRDFTVNGIFAIPATGEPVDYVGGREDIARGVIRAIGDPHARIDEDRLRMLRAVRFAARLGFRIDDATARAIRQHAAELGAVSTERVGDEMKRMLAHPERVRAATLVEELGLDGAVFGVRRGGGACRRLGSIPLDRPWTTALAAWLLDRFDGDAVDIAPEVRGLRARLSLSNDETAALGDALRIRERIRSEGATLGHAHRIRLFAAHGFDAALDLMAGEDAGHAERWRAEADRELPTRSLPEPLVDGNSLLRAGLRAGPQFKHLLDLAMDAQLEGRIDSAGQGLALVLDEAARISGNG